MRMSSWTVINDFYHVNTHQMPHRIMLCIALISVFGCADLEKQTREPDAIRQTGAEQHILSPSAPTASASRRVELGTRQVTTILDPGTDRFLNEGLVRRSIVREVLGKDGPSEFSINLVDVTVTEAAHAILLLWWDWQSTRAKHRHGPKFL